MDLFTQNRYVERSLPSICKCYDWLGPNDKIACRLRLDHFVDDSFLCREVRRGVGRPRISRTGSCQGRRAKISGKQCCLRIVVLEVTIDAEGKIEAVKVARDIVSLTPEAIGAVKGWKFSPAKLDGKPIRSKTTVAVVFNPALDNPPNATLPPLANNEQKLALRFSPPQVIEAVYPKYPIRSVAWGTVVLKIELDAEGRAKTIEILCDIASLTPGAVQAVKGWKFEPATLNGRQVPSKTTVAFLFRQPVHPNSR